MSRKGSQQNLGTATFYRTSVNFGLEEPFQASSEWPEPEPASHV